MGHGGAVRRHAVLGSVAAAMTAIGVVLLAGCTGTSAGSDSAEQAGGVAVNGAASAASAAGSAADGEAEPAAPTEVQAPAAASSGSGDSADSADMPLVDDRQIIRTASVALRVTAKPGADDEATRDALADAASQAATKVRALGPGTGGYVSASDGGGATVSVTLRIPADSYASVMTDLGGIGRVTSRTEKTDDVTDQMIDVASRVASMKASVQRIRTLLTKADRIADVISIESELAQREADLESLENRQTALKNQVALSTITVTITAVTTTDLAQTQAVQRHGFLAGLAGGWRALLAFGTWLGSVLGALLPFLPVIAVVVAVGIWAGHRRRQQHRPAASPPTGTGDLS